MFSSTYGSTRTAVAAGNVVALVGNLQTIVRRVAGFLTARRLVAGLCVVGVLLRFLVLCLFPDFITEDSDSYILASEFLRTQDTTLRIAFGHRQLGYPAVILAFRSFVPHPFFALSATQILLSVASCYLVYRICLRLGVGIAGSIVALAYCVLNRQSIVYSIVVAPETGLAFLLVLSTFVFLVHLDLLVYPGGSQAKSLSMFVVQALILCALMITKTLFNLFAVLVLMGYATALLAAWRRGGTRVGMQVGGFLLFLTLGGSLCGAALALERRLLETRKFYPFCAAWALSTSQYYMDLAGALHRDFKNAVRPMVLEGRRNLESLEYQLDGYRKGNVTNLEYDKLMSAYVRDRWHSTDDYDYYCDVEVFSRELLMEGLPRQVGHYTRWYLLPEVVRALFVSQPRDLGSFRFYTVRSFREFPQFYQEDRDSRLYHFVNHNPWARATVPWALGLLLNRVTFACQQAFSVAFIAYCLLFPFVRSLRPRSFVGWFGTCFLVIHAAAYVVVTGGLVWSHERYFMYTSFAIVVIGARMLSWLVGAAEDSAPKAGRALAKQARAGLIMLSVLVAVEIANQASALVSPGPIVMRLLF